MLPESTASGVVRRDCQFGKEGRREFGCGGDSAGIERSELDKGGRKWWSARGRNKMLFRSVVSKEGVVVGKSPFDWTDTESRLHGLRPTGPAARRCPAERPLRPPPPLRAPSPSPTTPQSRARSTAPPARPPTKPDISPRPTRTTALRFRTHSGGLREPIGRIDDGARWRGGLGSG